MIGRNSRPTRRNDATGSGDPIDKFTKSVLDYKFKALEMILDYKDHSMSSITQLIDTVAEDNIHESIYKRFWGTIYNWQKKGVSDHEKASVRHKIRTIYGCLDPGDSLPEAGKYVQHTFDLLLPSDPVANNLWLFKDTWVHWTQYELHSTARDHLEERENALTKLRCKAICDIWLDGGLDSVIQLAINSHALPQIGKALHEARVVDNPFSTITSVLRSNQLATRNSWWLIEGFLNELNNSERNRLIPDLLNELNDDQVLEILLAMNFNQKTWTLVDEQTESIAIRYWHEVPVHTRVFERKSTPIAMKRLMEANRPRAAFNAVINNWKHLDTDELTTLLEANTQNDSAESCAFAEYETADAFKSLSKRSDVELSRLTKLEFAFLPVLIGSSYGTPNVQKTIQQDPILFVQFLAALCKRNDRVIDPEEWRIDGSAQKQHFASVAYNLLDKLSIVPRDKNGVIKTQELETWIKEARKLCAKHGRSEFGDNQIGQLLAKEISDDCGGLPNSIASVFDKHGSESMADGFWACAHSLRGVYMKSRRGGYQEHELANKFRSYAENVAYLYPFTARALDMVADSYEREAIREDDELNVRTYLR